MKAKLEIKDGGKVTTYTADLSKLGEPVKKVTEKVEAFFKETFKDSFKKETYTKEE